MSQGVCMRILMLEDDLTLAALVIAYLQRHFTVDHVTRFEEARDYLEHYRYDIVLLDRNLDDMDIGMQLITAIKAANPETGVIIISAYDTIQDKITGLNLGADDYLDKPFDNDELLARIYALSRRRRSPPTVTLGPLACNLQTRTLRDTKGEIPLTRKESDLFFHLLKQRGRIVTKEELLDTLYVNPQNIASNTIDATIARLRKKLPPDLIKTIKTRGYLIE